MKLSILASAFTFLASASAVSGMAPPSLPSRALPALNKDRGHGNANLLPIVAFDRGYDDSSRSMSTVTCSDGPNGLMKKYPTQGAIPGFPNIGGVPGVGWNSPSVRHPPAAFSLL